MTSALVPNRQTFHLATPQWPFALVDGTVLVSAQLEVMQWGVPNADKSNAVLLCHSFSAEAHATGFDPEASENFRPWRQGQKGWWDALIGPNKAIDTNRYWVVCSNVLGGSAGSTGPMTLAPDGQPWEDRFPEISLVDIVALQRRLQAHLGIPRWKLVVGGSLGGLQSLEWAFGQPEEIESWCAIACAHKPSLAGIRHFAAGIEYIQRERDAGGTGHRALLHAFGTGRHFSGPAEYAPADSAWVNAWPEERYHPVSYLRLAQALLSFDLARDHGQGLLEAACSQVKAPGTLISFEEDDLFPPADTGHLHEALRRRGCVAVHHCLRGDAGHDSFLTNPDLLGPSLRKLLE